MININIIGNIIGNSRNDGGTPLTVTLTSDAADPFDNTFFTITTVFSGETTGITSGDFTLANCSIGSIFTNDDITYLVTIIPNFLGTVSVQFAASGTTSVVGNTPNAASNIISQTVLTEYVTNLKDEWIPHRNALVDSLATRVDNWQGFYNKTGMLSVGSPFPSLGTYTLTGSNYFNIGNAVALGWAGNISIFYRIPAATTLTNAVEVLWNSTGGDDFRLYAKVSAGAPRVGIRVIATIYTATTATWPQDGLAHRVGFVVNFPAGTCKYFVDGVLIETIAFTAATGIDYTTTIGSPVFGRLSSTVFYSQGFNKWRLYTEAVSDANAILLTASGSRFSNETITDTKDTRLVIWGGESIMVGHTAVASDFPVELQQEFVDILGYTSFTVGFTTTLAGTRPTTNCGPQIKGMYDLRLKYPDDNIFYVYQGNTGASLDPNAKGTNYYLSTGIGNNYTNLLALFRAAIFVLEDIELRNIIEISFCMAQGINDMDDATRSANYLTNLTAQLPNMRADFVGNSIALIKIIWERPHNHMNLTSGFTAPQVAAVRAAIDNRVAATQCLTIDTDNQTNFPLNSDTIHFLPAGTVELGRSFAALL